MEPPPPEFAFICIDNSTTMFWSKHLYKAQLDAIELYSATIFERNQDSQVCLYAMSSLPSPYMLNPTSDLKHILRCLKDLRCNGDTDSECALVRACSVLSRSPPNMKRKLLMFVGSCIDLQFVNSKLYGRMLKERGVALTVFNFFRLKIDTSLVGVGILSDEYHYARDQLCTLVTTVDDNENSQIVDVDESSILDILSKFILEKDLHYPEKEVALDNEYVEAPRTKYANLSKTICNEKNRAPARPKYVCMLDIPGLGRMFDPDKFDVLPPIPPRPGSIRGHNEKNKSAGNLFKKTTHVFGKEFQEKGEENVGVKQEELEVSCNEKYEAAAQGKGTKVIIKPETLCDLRRSIEQFHKETSRIAADDESVAQGKGINIFIKPETIRDLRRSIEQFHKETSTSIADDESVQAPEIQNLSKVTPQQRRAKKKKNRKKMPMFKQESELSCNEKNQAAAE